MTITITEIETHDVRFPTSRTLDGSDAVNVDPDYSAAYVILRTDKPGLEGHGLTFTNGRGNDVACAAIEALSPRVKGKTLDSITRDFAAFWYSIAGDTQLRWLGPEKGVIHLATGALVNAVWDLYAKAEGKPLWKLLVDMTAEQIVSAVPFTYLSDAITTGEALEILRRQEGTRDEREKEIRERGYPAYTTSAGWLGYTDEKIRRLLREALAEGWTDFKMKVGR